MATIFEPICYHVHVAGWLRKWPKWAIGSTSASSPGAWHVRKSPDNGEYPMILGLVRKKRYGIQCLKNIGLASTWLCQILWNSVSRVPWNVTTYSCPRYQFLVHKYSVNIMPNEIYSTHQQVTCSALHNPHRAHHRVALLPGRVAPVLGDTGYVAPHRLRARRY